MRRANGTGAVVKLSGKRRKKYAARITTGKHLNKSGHMVPTYEYIGTFYTAREAQAYLDKYVSAPDIQTKEMLLAKVPACPTFAVVYDETIAYLSGRKRELSDSSYKALQAAFHNLSDLHHIRMCNIDYDILNAAIAKNSGKSRSTINNLRNLLKKMYTYSIKKKYVNEDISKLCDFDFTPPVEEIHTPFTREEISLIHADAESDARDMVLILLYTGLRVQELLELKTENIHLAEQYFITGVKTDAGKNRIVPIHDKLLLIMKKHYHPKQYYFWNLDGSQRIYQTIRWRFDRYMKKLGLNHLPHDTRHSTATYLYDAGVNEMYIKLILGHNLEDITQRVYIHTHPEILVREINRMKL